MPCADGQHGTVLHLSLTIVGIFRGATAHIHEQCAELSFVVGQHRLSRGQGLEHQLRHFDTGAVDTGHQGLAPGDVAGHQMDGDL